MRWFLAVSISAVVVLAASGAHALERRAARVGNVDGEPWTSASTCAITYYNYCNGWLWGWSGFPSGGRVGVQFDGCGEGAELRQTGEYMFGGIPFGYSYVGSMRIYATDADGCPMGAPLATWTRRFHDSAPGSWWVQSWHHLRVPSSFALVWEGGIPGVGFLSDHPGRGPTGPEACGLCYPVTRQNHSFVWGPPSAPCPGAPLNHGDSACDAQLLWYATLSASTATEPSTWARVKAMYR